METVMRSVRLLALVVLVVATGFTAYADDETKPANGSETFLTVRIIDEDGKPVADAQAGFKYVENFGNPSKFLPGLKSDKDGLVKFAGEECEKAVPQMGIYARHADRHLVAVHDTAEASAENMLTLEMVPECDVSYRLSCSQMSGSKHIWGSDVAQMMGWGFTSGNKNLAQGTALPEALIHVYLPPGKYGMYTYGNYLINAKLPVEIQPGQRELNLGTIDHPATNLGLLIGQPAPELHDVIEWKNGPAPKFAELRGKVVLLEFWGWWCGVCIYRGIPEMFKLQEEYQGRDLVIIGVHIDTEANEVCTVEKLDEKLVSARKNAWNGKDISFPVALVPAKRTPLGSGIEQTSRTKSCAEFGIKFCPTSVLIGRDGKVVGMFLPSEESHRAKLKRMLDETSAVP